MTDADTVGVGADSIAVLPPKSDSHVAYTIQATLDIDDMVAKGYSGADGDIFQLLEVPAGVLVLNAGAEVMKAFNSSVTADIDFAGGDDIVDGADVTSTGFCAAGSNGQTNTVVGSAASTYTQFVTTLIRLMLHLLAQHLLLAELGFMLLLLISMNRVQNL